MVKRLAFFGALSAFFVLFSGHQAAAYTDVTSKTYERNEIAQAIAKGWITPLTADLFGYGVTITQREWQYMLMFVRSSDACPEFGRVPTEYWTSENIKGCLTGAGVPLSIVMGDTLRRDEAMQQLFALRRRSFAFQSLQTKPSNYSEPNDMAQIPLNRQGAMIAADRLKLLFRSKNAILPASALLREDAILAVTRFMAWEQQGGVESQTNDTLTISREATLNHWRDLDTDMYVLEIKTGGDTYVRPILPRRSFNAAKDPVKEKIRDEFVYEPVSSLAKDSGALAAINGSYFNVQWPWGALEDVAIVNGKTYLQRSDRSTFVACKDGTFFIGVNDDKRLKAAACTPEQALGAGPLFMTNGEGLTENTKEGFDEYTQWERRVGTNARTAVAISKDRKTAYLIVVAGKSYPAFGRGGATLAAFLKEKYPEISEAMMYDGGGSSTLVANGAVLVGSGESGNTAERAVVSALGIFSKKAEAVSQKQFARAKASYWDDEVVPIRVARPAKAFAWQKPASGSRASSLKLMDAEDNVQVFTVTYDKIAHDAKTNLTITRREGTHERGWTIPTEIHVINPKEESDIDIIRLFAYMPAAQKPDLKTFDVTMFGKTGIIFGDATGRNWFYYAKTKQLMPATFPRTP